jgi:DNA repair protein RadC
MPKKIKDLPKHGQPKDLLVEKGSENLRDSELLAILLQPGMEGKDVLKISEDLLDKFPKKKLLSLDFKQLSQIKGIGPSKACLLLAAFELSKRALEVEDNCLPVINSAKTVMAQLQELRHAKKEHLVVLYLNSRNELLHKETFSSGTLNANSVHPRVVFEPALRKLATRIVIAHNHPSGDTNPSEDDIAITKRLDEAGQVLGIEMIDHMIVSQNGWTSFKEINLI